MAQLLFIILVMIAYYFIILILLISYLIFDYKHHPINLTGSSLKKNTKMISDTRLRPPPRK